MSLIFVPILCLLNCTVNLREREKYYIYAWQAKFLSYICIHVFAIVFLHLKYSVYALKYSFNVSLKGLNRMTKLRSLHYFDAENSPF